MLPFLAAIYWNVNPIIAHIGPVTLRWYGLFFMLPFVVGTFVLTHIYRSERVSPQWVDVITIYMLIGTVVGARLGHMLSPTTRWSTTTAGACRWSRSSPR